MSSFNWDPQVVDHLLIDGVRLEARCVGPSPSEAPTLVLLHEGLGCVALWRDFPARLAEATGCGVLVWSRRGYGQSDTHPPPWPLDYMTREAEDVLPRVLDAVGVRQVVLLGHSDGASIAAIHGGSAQDHRVRGLVLMAPHFFTEPVALAAIDQARQDYETGDLRTRLQLYHADVDAAFHGWNGAWLDPGFVDWNITDCLDYLRVPVLVIQGRQDQYGTEEQVRIVAERSYAPVEVLMLDSCRHAPHAEQPTLTLDAIAAFTHRLIEFDSLPVARSR